MRFVAGQTGAASVIDPRLKHNIQAEVLDDELPMQTAVPQCCELRYLTAAEYPAWDALVRISPDASVFCSSWLLTIVSPDVRILGYFESGRLVAGIPLHYERRMGVRCCCMPKLIQNWGIVMEPSSGKTVRLMTRETRILSAFAERLAREAIFIHMFNPGFNNWLPFYWKGFTQTTHYTYVIDQLGSLRTVWEGLESRQRSKILKTRRDGLVVRPCEPELVFNLSSKTFQRHGKQPPFSLAYFQSLCDVARGHNAGSCFAVEDRYARMHAAAFLIWDAKRAYYLVSGHDPEFGNSYAASLLIWHLIEFAAERTKVFDFEGSMIRSLERFFRSFGAQRVPYYRITNLPRWLRIPLCLIGKFQI